MRIHSAVLLTALCSVSHVAWGTDARVYDIHPPVAGQQHAGSAAVQAKIDAFQHQLGGDAMVNVQWDSVGNQLSSVTFSPPLPAPTDADAVKRARAFLESNREVFGLTTSVLGAMTPQIEVREAGRDVVSFNQTFNGIPFYEQQGYLRVVLTPQGVAAASGHYATSPPLETTAKLSVSDAYLQLRRQLPNLWKTADGKPSPHDGETGSPTFEPDPTQADPNENGAARDRTLIKHVGMDFTDELTARLTYFLDGPQPRLAWEFSMRGTQARFATDPNTLAIAVMDVLIDAQEGRVLFAQVNNEPLQHGIASIAP